MMKFENHKKEFLLFLELERGYSPRTIQFYKSDLDQYSDFVHKNKIQFSNINKELIFDLKMGQTQKQFFTDCWELNKKKLINQGPNNKFVRHVLDSVSPIYNPKNNMELLFYGIFNEKKILTGLKMRISFLGWDPTVKGLQKEFLLEEGMKMMDQIFPGNKFLKLNKEVNNSPIMAKVDGNRLISAYVYDNRFVELKIEDWRLKIAKK